MWISDGRCGTLPFVPTSVRGRHLSADHHSNHRQWDSKLESLTIADERRRIARELHESTSHLLIELQLQVRKLNDFNDPKARSLIAEFQGTIDEIRDHVSALNRE
jgi:signal transduction histidine kinase